MKWNGKTLSHRKRKRIFVYIGAFNDKKFRENVDIYLLAGKSYNRDNSC